MYSHSWRSLSEYRGLFRTQSSIWGGKFLKKLLTTSFCKKVPLSMCDRVLNTPLGLFSYTVYVLLEFQHDHSEAVVRRCSVKKVFLEISQNSQENACFRDSFLIKLQANFIKKESLAQVFSCKFCKISQNTFFYRTPPVAALKFSSEGMLFLVNIQTEEQQLYKTELFYLYLIRIYENFQYLPLIYCKNLKWSWKSIYFGRASPDSCFQHLSFKVLNQNCPHYDYIR